MDIRKILSSEDVNTDRQFEADMAKFVCMTGMVIVHCFDVFMSFSEMTGSVQFAFGTVLNAIFGAGTFMFCMGLGIAYSKNAEASVLIRRGVKIFFLGYLLNLCCALSYLILLKDVELFITYLLGLDILQFAGLALLTFGLLKKAGDSDKGIGITAVAMSIAGSFLRTIDLGSLPLNIFFGLFIGTFDYKWMTGGIFPLFNWFIFVAAGYLFAKYVLKKCTDKKALYGRTTIVTGVILAIYMGIAVPRKLGMMASVLRINQVIFPDALILICGAVFALGVYDLLSVLFSEKAKACITRVSRNITIIYFLQWVILSVLVSVWSLKGSPAIPEGIIVLMGLVLFVLCAFLAKGIRALGRKASERPVKKP